MNMSAIIAMFEKKQFVELLDYISKHCLDIEGDISEEKKVKLFYYQALSLMHLRKYSEALKAFELCMDSPHTISYTYQCHMIRGYIYTITGKLKNAELEFETLLSNGYESSRTYSAAAHVAYKQNKVSIAVKYLQKALTMDPNNANALNSMSYILSWHNTKIALALKYIEQALENNSDNPAYLDTYGVVLTKLKRYKDAKRVLDLASKMSDHEDIIKHLKELKDLQVDRGYS